MSAEILRRAAALMRERADCGSERNYPAPWGVRRTGDVEQTGLASIVTCDNGDGDVTDWVDDELAEHIASWHPAVALAVAKLLDEAASAFDHTDFCLDCFHPTCLTVAEALAIARAYLNENA